MERRTWTEEDLAKRYEEIKSSKSSQHENFAKFMQNAGEEQVRKWQSLAEDLQLELDTKAGRVRYKNNFQPLDLQVDICYVRHGKTQGNTEPRVYQGMVDYPENQLNSIGKEQAVAAAHKMEEVVKHSWGLPDIIVSSPLQRAQQTAQPFRDNHPEVPYHVLPELMEMKFGSWDNEKVADLPADNICHLFYLEQNALVKSHEPHRVDSQTWVHGEWLEGATTIEGENFLECMRRQREALRKVDALATETLKKAHPNETRRPRVAFASRDYSMPMKIECFSSFSPCCSSAFQPLPIFSNTPAAAAPASAAAAPAAATATTPSAALAAPAAVGVLRASAKDAVVYGHSMAGAAVSVLLGFGKEDASGWLGFDGHYIMPNATPTLLVPEHRRMQQQSSHS
ncbi:hypothetical protein Emed_006699 [Eimeria media]